MCGEAAGDTLTPKERADGERRVRARRRKWAEMLGVVAATPQDIETVTVDEDTTVQVVAVELSTLNLPPHLLAQLRESVEP